MNNQPTNQETKKKQKKKQKKNKKLNTQPKPSSMRQKTIIKDKHEY